MPPGSIISSPASAVASISTSAALRASLVKSHVLLGLSQCKWCLLKLPSQIVCTEPCGTSSRWLACSPWNFDSAKIVLLFSWSLYILKMVSFPQMPISCTTVMLLEGKSICSQLSVQSAAHIRMIDLVLAGFSACVVGYITIQSLLTMGETASSADLGGSSNYVNVLFH